MFEKFEYILAVGGRSSEAHQVSQSWIGFGGNSDS